MSETFANDILGAQPEPAVEAAATLASTGAPSNQQIVDAAKAAYTSYRGAVDAATQALVASVKDASLKEARTTLDATDWSGAGLSSALTEPFFSFSATQNAIEVVHRTAGLNAFSVGAFTHRLPAGGPGVVGFCRDAGAESADTGLVVSLDIFNGLVTVDQGQNLQYGVWLGAPADLHTRVLGMYVNTTLQGVSVNLKILLTQALEPYGFLSSAGASVPVASGVFAGSTGQWTP